MAGDEAESPTESRSEEQPGLRITLGFLQSCFCREGALKGV